jgi:hypothetical protein
MKHHVHCSTPSTECYGVEATIMSLCPHTFAALLDIHNTSTALGVLFTHSYVMHLCTYRESEEAAALKRALH